MKPQLASAIAVVVLLSAVFVGGQARSGSDPSAQPLTIFNREGQIVATLGEPGLYSQPAFSPDGTRVAVVKADPQTQNQDIWMLSVATGASTRITFDPSPDTEPAWSPDGRQLAFISRRGGSWSLYRKASNAEGSEEQVYQHAGFGGVSNLAWSADGRFLSFSDLINISGALYVLPLDGDHRPREVLRPPLFNGRISYDGRLIAYPSNQSGTIEIFVRPFDATSTPESSPSGGPWRVSTNGAVGAAFWRSDGKEMYYLEPGRGIMAVDVGTAPTFRTGTPRLLFRPSTTRAAVRLASVSPDGARFVLAVPPTPLARQLTVFDRAGRLLQTVGEPGPYGQPSISADGRRVAVVRNDPDTGNQDIWAFDVGTGKSHAITSDPSPDAAPIWSPDGKRIAFVSTRGDYTGIYRKAWNGTGTAELLYQHTPGTPSLVLTDWSVDGRFLSFYAGDVLYVLTLSSVPARQAIEVARSEFSTVGGRFSPETGFLAYLSDHSGRYEVYVRSFVESAGRRLLVDTQPLQISRQGAQGMISWSQDGEEISYKAADGSLMAVDFKPGSILLTGAPRLMFRPPSLGNGGPYGSTGNPAQLRNVSHDGKRIVFAVQIEPNLPGR